jgi:hypothetical protein
MKTVSHRRGAEIAEGKCLRFGGRCRQIKTGLHSSVIACSLIQIIDHSYDTFLHNRDIEIQD